MSIRDFSGICYFCSSFYFPKVPRHRQKDRQTDKDKKKGALFLRTQKGVENEEQSTTPQRVSGRKTLQESVTFTTVEKTNASTPWTCRNRVKVPQLPDWGQRRPDLKVGKHLGDHGYALKGPNHCSIRLRQQNPQCCKNFSKSLFSIKTLLKCQSQEHQVSPTRA